MRRSEVAAHAKYTARTRYTIPDGNQRSTEDERNLNKAFAAWINRPEAQAAIDHLERITGAAHGPENISTERLIHQAGQRWIVWLIKMRAAYGNANLPAAEEQENGDG